MEKKQIQNISLFYEPQESETAGIILDALPGIQLCIGDTWGLDSTIACKTYVMTSWQQFMFHSAAWPRKILMGLFYPLVYLQVRRTWALAGGYTLPAKTPVVGIKPYHMIQSARNKIGERIFVPEESPEEKIQHIACHEFTHAFSSYLQLPMWLHEGLAMGTVDKFLGKNSIRKDTLDVLSQPFANKHPRTYRNLDPSDVNTTIYQIVRGYWLTRFLEDTNLDTLKDLLKIRLSPMELENRIAKSCHLETHSFWQEIDSKITAHFSN
ncbi:MAG: hypothetical protein JEZ06_10320 [Anaerolineaceae bacterium]|nr:hypothetical protein [Anaerolineaceae bacterium]